MSLYFDSLRVAVNSAALPASTALADKYNITVVSATIK